MTRVLVCSTYELGAQPLGCAVPAAVLVDAGHEVRVTDLSIEALSSDDLAWAQAITFSVPMHTAVRLGLAALEQVRATRPDLPICFHGLYAPIALASGHFFSHDLIAAGEVSEALLEWVAQIALGVEGSNESDNTPTVRIELGSAKNTSPRPLIPLRSGLPELSSYARLIGHGAERLVGTVEATTGCNHRCRHCPVPVVYDGRSRPNNEAAVLADIDQLVVAGAEHVHFADPDFLNRPGHARRIVEAMHRAHPDLSFDATIKVSHLLRHRDLVSMFASEGCVFVISAFESASDVVLSHLDKGHVAAELPEAVDILRAKSIEPRPSFLPFTPWTTRADVIAIFDLVARHDLIDNVDPIQYGIRLLLPPGSLLLDDPDPQLSESLTELDPAGIAMQWRSADPVLDDVAVAIALRAEAAEAAGESNEVTYHALRALIHEAFGQRDVGLPEPEGRRGPESALRPKLSESWFCCAEPTQRQRAVAGTA